ncbi:ParB/RepB/Spo0J family partition protein (plasmid) [Tundrisphaera lichenicola]|uniref:ParB/RepB/Spo0J family partition protein n=1 Tax=Tundrisphaera lichenicola TaxID=2029860 RepID=UPI003EBCEABF
MNINGWSENQLARELGVSQPSVVAALKLLALPTPVQDPVEAGDLPASSASAIASLDDPDEQAEVAARVVAEGLSRAETVEAVRQAASKPRAGGGSKGRTAIRERPRRPTVRTIKTLSCRLTLEFKRAVEPAEVRAALAEALAKVAAEFEIDQDAA